MNGFSRLGMSGLREFVVVVSKCERPQIDDFIYNRKSILVLVDEGFDGTVDYIF